MSYFPLLVVNNVRDYFYFNGAAINAFDHLASQLSLINCQLSFLSYPLSIIFEVLKGFEGGGGCDIIRAGRGGGEINLSGF